MRSVQIDIKGLSPKNLSPLRNNHRNHSSTYELYSDTRDACNNAQHTDRIAPERPIAVPQKHCRFPYKRCAAMDSTDKAFTGSIAQLYERLLVPLIFAPYARDLAARIAQVRSRRILETAAGTGVLTRALAAQLPADGAITATDLNEPMLAQAKAVLPDPRVAWRQADALALPFEDSSFDVAACQFGVMFFPDRVKGHAEARRVLAPGGRLFFNVWDRIEDNEFADTITQALAEVFPNDPP